MGTLRWISYHKFAEKCWKPWPTTLNYKTPSSETQGQLVGAKRSNPGRNRSAKVFYKSKRAPGKRVSPDHFQAFVRMLAPAWLMLITIKYGRYNNRRVRTHESDSEVTVHRLGKIIQRIYFAQSGASICTKAWKWSRETRFPGALLLL